MSLLPPSPFVAESSMEKEVFKEAALAGPPNNRPASELLDDVLDEAARTDCIGEIFVGARKLNLPRFKLDEEQFMADLDEPPLFLRRAG